jgi:hypothetical protein
MEIIAGLLLGMVPFLAAFAALLAVTVLAVVGMLRIFGRVSGLNQLSQVYSAPSTPTGPTLAGRTVQIGAVRYRRCVTVNVSDAGLYLWARPVLSRHQPILIPWSEVKQAQETILYWQRAMRLSIGLPEVATITLPMDLFTLVSPYVGPEAQGTAG